jgi:hypothetical protein
VGLDPKLQPVDLQSVVGAETSRALAEEALASIRMTLAAGKPQRENAVTAKVSPVRSPARAADSSWDAVLQRLRDSIPGEEFETWIAPLTLVMLEGELAVIATPNIFVRNEVRERYAVTVTAALASEIGRPCQIELVIDQPMAA